MSVLSFFLANLYRARLQKLSFVPLQNPALRASDPAPKDPIFEAIEQNDQYHLLKILIDRKRHLLPLYVDSRKWTAYHLAASKPEGKECLKILLMYGRPNFRSDEMSVTELGYTPLHIACERGCDENALLLLRKGWNPEQKTNAGSTALHLAVLSGSMETVRHLLDYKANVNSVDEYYYTPLHLSAKTPYSDVTGILLENGADVLSVNSECNIPLLLACECSTFETVCLLLQRNSACINFQNYYGLTPFMKAVRKFDAHAIKYLLNVGARADICDVDGRLAVHFVDASLDGVEIFSLLMRSIDVDYLRYYCVSTTLQVLNDLRGVSFTSFTCLAIEKGVDYLNILMNSHLPKSILQMPSFKHQQCSTNHRYYVYAVFSPVACLLYLYTEKKIEAFDQCLASLFEHKIIMMDEFQRMLPTKWPISNVQYVNPLSMLCCDLWPDDKRKYYIKKLIANNVTTDYCLQCYHDNKKPFATFNEYQIHYCLVIYAVEKYCTEAVKFLISNSVILEPDLLCNYLIMAYTKNQHQSSKKVEKARNLYQYLINLKPVYHKWYKPFNRYDLQSFPFLPAAEHVSDEAVAKFCGIPYNFQRSPIFAVSGPLSEPREAIQPDLEVFPYIKPTEEFANVTLQQLCRTAIRQQLRERTLEDNLCNFQGKILELPLPKLLKNYLLFKN